MKIYLDDVFSEEWKEQNVFEKAFALTGESFREVKSRRTIRFELNGKGYFAKLHRGIGWKEVLKDLFQFKKPITDAGNEYRAIRLLEKLEVDTMTCAAFGVRGWNPAKKESFIITEELTGVISLEDLAKITGEHAVPYRQRGALIRQLAAITGSMHRDGMNHRDCYICHFLLKKDTINHLAPTLYVIDLHRAQIRDQVSYRYLVKDVAGLYFSAMDANLSKREVCRFIREYSRKSLPDALRQDRKFWRDVDRTARKLYRAIHQKDAPELN
jgi:heptose I phosphotransferase